MRRNAPILILGSMFTAMTYATESNCTTEFTSDIYHVSKEEYATIKELAEILRHELLIAREKFIQQLVSIAPHISHPRTKQLVDLLVAQSKEPDTKNFLETHKDLIDHMRGTFGFSYRELAITR